MTSSLLNLVDNLAEKSHENKSKDCDSFLEYESVKDNLKKHKSCKFLFSNKYYSNRTDEELKNDSRTHLSFIIMISINLFCC